MTSAGARDYNKGGGGAGDCAHIGVQTQGSWSEPQSGGQMGEDP